MLNDDVSFYPLGQPNVFNFSFGSFDAIILSLGDSIEPKPSLSILCIGFISFASSGALLSFLFMFPNPSFFILNALFLQSDFFYAHSYLCTY